MCNLLDVDQINGIFHWYCPVRIHKYAIILHWLLFLNLYWNNKDSVMWHMVLWYWLFVDLLFLYHVEKSVLIQSQIISYFAMSWSLKLKHNDWDLIILKSYTCNPLYKIVSMSGRYRNKHDNVHMCRQESRGQIIRQRAGWGREREEENIPIT